MRHNTHSILSQLSSLGSESADPTSIQTIRQTLVLDGTVADPGLEGASNLFYYLFDDWRAVYKTISRYSQRLQELVCLSAMVRSSAAADPQKRTNIFKDIVRMFTFVLDNANKCRQEHPTPAPILRSSPTFTSWAARSASRTICTLHTRPPSVGS
jgi:hypothetical protein